MNSGPHAAKLRGYLTVSASSHRSCYPPDSEACQPRNTGQRTHLTVGFLFSAEQVTLDQRIRSRSFEQQRRIQIFPFHIFCWLKRHRRNSLRQVIVQQHTYPLLTQSHDVVIDPPIGVTSENGKNRTVSRWHGLASRKRSFLRGFNENQIRASAGMACCFLENHSHIARLKQPSFENHENAVSRGWQLAQSRAVAGYRIS